MMKLVVFFGVLATAAASGLIVPLASNYRGPLSLAPGQPANIIAADGRPLDTLDVNLDRSAHYTAKALSGTGFHLLKKRSAPLVAHVAVNRLAVAPAPLFAHAPLAYSTAVVSRPISAVPYAYAHAPLVHW